MFPSADRLPERFNWFEVVLWPALGIGLLYYCRDRPRPIRRRGLIAFLTLVAFGGSDWAEARTGNTWWHPWWLLLWKAACVVVLVGLAFEAYHRVRRSRR